MRNPKFKFNEECFKANGADISVMWHWWFHQRLDHTLKTNLSLLTLKFCPNVGESESRMTECIWVFIFLHSHIDAHSQDMNQLKTLEGWFSDTHATKPSGDHSSKPLQWNTFLSVKCGFQPLVALWDNRWLLHYMSLALSLCYIKFIFFTNYNINRDKTLVLPLINEKLKSSLYKS
jgi:hypothetical protein